MSLSFYFPLWSWTALHYCVWRSLSPQNSRLWKICPEFEVDKQIFSSEIFRFIEELETALYSFTAIIGVNGGKPFPPPTWGNCWQGDLKNGIVSTPLDQKILQMVFLDSLISGQRDFLHNTWSTSEMKGITSRFPILHKSNRPVNMRGP